MSLYRFQTNRNKMFSNKKDIIAFFRANPRFSDKQHSMSRLHVQAVCLLKCIYLYHQIHP